MSIHVKSFRGHTPTLGSNVYINATALVLGEVHIDKDSSIWPMAVVRGDMNSIWIGERTSIQDGSVLHITHPSSFNPKGYKLTIGNEVTVGHNATLHGCTIGDRCLIGIGATILDGAVVEKEVIVAAGSLVPPRARLKSGFLYKGSPAKPSRPITEKERTFFSYSATNYVNLKNEFLVIT